MATVDKGDTWPKVLVHNYEAYGDRRIAMRYKNRGVWRPVTWKDYALEVKRLALGLLALGFHAGDRLLIIGDNAPQWHYAELAAQVNHGAAIGAHPDLGAEELGRIFENCAVRFAVVQDQEQVDKLFQVRDELTSAPSTLNKIIYWNYKGLAHYADPILIGYREAVQLGESYGRGHAGCFDENVKSGKADDICALDSAGAALTYKAMKITAGHYLQLDPWSEKDNALPCLPPVGMTEQCLGIACHLLSGCTLDFAETPVTLRRDAREIGPSLIFQQARQWENQATLVQARILQSDALKRSAFRLLKPVGDRMAEIKTQGKKPSLGQQALYAVADLVLFKPIRASLGLAKARLCYSYGERLRPEATLFYEALNLPLRNLCDTRKEGAA